MSYDEKSTTGKMIPQLISERMPTQMEPDDDENDFLTSFPSMEDDTTNTSKETNITATSTFSFSSTLVIFLTSMSLGSALVTLPFTVIQIGVPGFFFTLTFSSIMLWYTTKLTKDICSRTFEKDKELQNRRDPFAVLVELAYGKSVRRFFIVFFIMTVVATAISNILVAADMLHAIFPLPSLNNNGQVHLWTVVLAVLFTPLSLLGSMKDYSLPSVIGAGFAFIGFVMIMVITFAKGNTVSSQPSCRGILRPTFMSFMTAFGTIFNAVNGPMLIIPNIVAENDNQTNIGIAILSSYLISYMICLATACLPYFMFGADIQEDIFCSLIAYSSETTWMRVLTYISMGIISISLLLGVLVILNPVMQEIEHAMNSPNSKLFYLVKILEIVTKITF